MGLSDASEIAFCNDWFVPAAPAYNPPATHWISLHDGDPSDTGASEISGGSYARIEVTAPATFWSAAANRRILNTAEVAFPGMPAVPSLTHCGIWDAVTGGNFMAGNGLLTARNIGAGDTARFGVNELIIQMTTTDLFSDYAVHAWLNRQFRLVAYTRPTSHTLQIYNGDPYAAGSPVGGATPQAIAFAAPAPSGNFHACQQNNGDIDFTALTGGDTLDHWLIEDHLSNNLIRRNQTSQTVDAGDDVQFGDGTILVGVN